MLIDFGLSSRSKILSLFDRCKRPCMILFTIRHFSLSSPEFLPHRGLKQKKAGNVFNYCVVD